MLRALHQRLMAFFAALLREHTAPGRVALAIVVGCMVGCTPLFGLHLPVCVALALLLRLNQVVVYGAANISIPPLVPLLGLASVQTGELLLHGRLLLLSRADFQGHALPALAGRFFVSWLVGGLVVGAGVGLVGAGVFYALRRRPTPDAAPATDTDLIGQALLRAADRYRTAPPRFRYYARAKYRMDPCYRAILALVPPGAFVVDLGTGLGMLPVALAELGDGRAALGVDWDEARTQAGRAAAAGLPVQIVTGDARGFDLPPCDVVTLVDVLHYYDPAGQRGLLGRAAAALRPGGLLLVRDADGARAGGARFTRVVERAMVLLRWNRGPGVRFRSAADLQADLESLGLRTRRADTAGALHPGNVLLCGQRE